MSNAGKEERGAIFTKREVVCFILDLAGYSSRRKLYRKTILEPSFGHGEFLSEIIDRMLASFLREFDPEDLGEDQIELLGTAVRGVELHGESFDRVKKDVVARLRAHGFSRPHSQSLAVSWLHKGDYLLTDFEGMEFDFVVGNPPYVRQEMIPDGLLAVYRNRFSTMYDRADLYVPFMEKSLSLLASGGAMSFICADRWTKNKYGRPLRELVSQYFHLAHFVPMADSMAFHQEVSAYPAVVVISNSSGQKTRIAKVDVGLSALPKLSKEMRKSKIIDDSRVVELNSDLLDGAPWVLTVDPETNLVRELEGRLPTLEEAGCKVGIGVATGADKIFVGDFNELDVEDSRKLPLAMTCDIDRGSIKWTGKGVVNPFLDDGTLATFSDYPRMAAFFLKHEKRIKARNVAKRNRVNWYRTIDRIYPSLANETKLLIPDIRGEATVLLENQGLYPHHNLYFVTSPVWDLAVLQAILLSGLTKLFVSAYSTRMRGGFLRYQAQYLRRVRVPEWRNVPGVVRRDLRRAIGKRDLSACNSILADLLDLSKSDRVVLENIAA